MAETIKEIYENVTNLLNQKTAPFINNIINESKLKHIEYILSQELLNIYPYYEFNIKLSFNEIDNSISIKLNPDFSTFPSIGYYNYHTHNFKEKIIKDHYFINPLMQCVKCQLIISKSGSLIDGDYSCNEFLIKKMLE